MSHFTHYWTNKTVREHQDGGFEGELLDHTAGNAFPDGAVKVGASIYTFTVIDGRLFLLGGMIVAFISHSDAETEKLLGFEPWSASIHFLASHATAMSFSREVPVEITKQLLFKGPRGHIGLKFLSPKSLDEQTLRGVRSLTDEPALLLDSLLPRLMRTNLRLDK